MAKTVDVDPLTKAAQLRDLPDAALREAIAGLLLDHPDLGMSGYGVALDVRLGRHLLLDEAVAQTRRALNFLASGTVAITDKPSPLQSSYAWKHRCERWAMAYTCNGSFLAACLMAGVPARRIRGTPNLSLALVESRQPVRLNRFGVGRRAA
jgi:hypothetical protein